MSFEGVVILIFMMCAIMYLLHKNKLNTITRMNNKNERLETILSSIEDGVLIADTSGNIIYANAMIEKVLKDESKSLDGMSEDEILSIIKEKIYQNNNYCGHEEINETVANTHNIKLCFNITTKNVRDEYGNIIENIYIIPNMRECDEAHQFIHKMAHYDLLTGLANRVLINETLDKMLIDAKSTNSELAVAFIDLDNFKLINDTMGHDAGDSVLKKAGKIIEESLEDGDFAGRFGGDEFIIVMHNAHRTEDISRKIGKVTELLNKPVHIKDKELYIPASVGVAVYPKDGDTAEILIKNADVAMYSAKGVGKNTCKLYNSKMNYDAAEKLKMINDLKNAVKNNEFTIYYQPQIDISTNEVVGMEALIRWQHPQNGLVPPLDFIPLAEETGLIVPIGEWVLREACRQNKFWQDKGYKPMRISVNLSIVQFEHHNLVNTIKSILDETGLSPMWLELEITESLAVKCFDCAVRRIKELKQLGVYISLDDFGTGYSSYSYLNQLPIDSLKIDKIFLENLKKDSDEEFITKNMISLAKKLKLTVIAEGVETTSQLDFIKKQKCNIAQGFLFSRPLPADEYERLVNKASA